MVRTIDTYIYYGHKHTMIMKGNGLFAVVLSAALLVSGCGSISDGGASGGFLGAELGSILGSAIGGISGGPRGSDVGTIVGMAGGAVIGAVVGDTADKAQQRKAERYDGNYRGDNRNGNYRGDDRNGNSSYDSRSYGDSDDDATSDFDPENGGDDVIQFDAPADNTSVEEPDVVSKLQSDPAPVSASPLELRSVRFVGKGNGLELHSGELAKVVVEVYNNTPEYMYNVKPMVMETSGNKHVFVSAPIIVEKIAPGKGIRYTAMVKADKKLKDGKVHFTVCAQESAQLRKSEIREFDVTTIR